MTSITKGEVLVDHLITRIIMIFFLVTVTLFIQSCTPAFGSRNQSHNAGKAAQMKMKYQELRAEYLQLKNAGHDMTAVDQKFEALKSARAQKNWPEVRRLLMELDQDLEAMQTSQSSATSTDANDTPPPPPTKSVSPLSDKPSDVRGFSLGVEYLPRLAVADIYGQLGIKWAKSAGIEWNHIEPKPPSGGKHYYRWELVDKILLAWQKAGIENLQLWIKCTAKWATKPVRTRKGASRRSSSPPKDGYWDDYSAFVENFVERYDKDGKDDAPGLLYPIRFYQIEAEVQHNGQWQNGTPNEYLKLLETASRAAKRAHPDTKIILAGFAFLGLVDDLPSNSVLDQRLASNLKRKRQYENNIQILSRPELYDYAAFNYLTDYRSAYGITSWIREQMRRYGEEKPIWASDAFSALLIYKNEVNPKFPSSDTRIQLFEALRNPSSAKSRQTVEWFRAYQAAEMTRKVLVSLETGLAGINIGNTRDWTEMWRIESHYQKSTAPMGLVDMTTNKTQVQSWRGRPAYYMLSYLVELVNTVDSVTRLDAPEGVYALKLISREGPIFALWYDDYKAHLPGEPMARTQIRATVDSQQVTVTTTISNEGAKKPEQDVVNIDDGKLVISLDERPIFIEGCRELSFY